MSEYTKNIQKRIEQIPYNQIIIASELYFKYFSEVAEPTYYKILERMTKQDRLIHLTKGIYYRPKINRFGKIPITEEDIAQYYIQTDNGIVIGYNLYNSKGITTQISKKIEILSTELAEEKKNIGNVVINKVKIQLDENTKPVIETLEILQNYYKIENINNERLMLYMNEFAKRYSDKTTQYVIENRKYKKSTIAFLASFLDYLEVNHSLNRYLSSLSRYAIPNMETIYESTQ